MKTKCDVIVSCYCVLFSLDFSFQVEKSKVFYQYMVNTEKQMEFFLVCFLACLAKCIIEWTDETQTL